MKKSVLLLMVFVCTTISITTTKANGNLPPFLEFLEDFLEQSEVFDEETSFLWIDYQAVSSRLSRDDYSKAILPPIGINFEKRIIGNLGLKASYSANFWKESKTLVQSNDKAFNEEFRYFYNTFSLGATWHVTVAERIDPYIGFSVSYRNIYAKCDCESASNSKFSPDFAIGARYLLNDRYFANIEVSHSGVGYIKAGIGYRFGDF